MSKMKQKTDTYYNLESIMILGFTRMPFFECDKPIPPRRYCVEKDTSEYELPISDRILIRAKDDCSDHLWDYWNPVEDADDEQVVREYIDTLSMSDKLDIIEILQNDVIKRAGDQQIDIVAFMLKTGDTVRALVDFIDGKEAA